MKSFLTLSLALTLLASPLLRAEETPSSNPTCNPSESSSSTCPLSSPEAKTEPRAEMCEHMQQLRAVMSKAGFDFGTAKPKQ